MKNYAKFQVIGTYNFEDLVMSYGFKHHSNSRIHRGFNVLVQSDSNLEDLVNCDLKLLKHSALHVSIS